MGSGLQVCLSYRAGWGNKFGKDSNPGLMGAILESVREDGLPATGYAKAVAGNVINILWAREVSWPKLIQFYRMKGNATQQRFGCKSAIIKHS